MPVLEEFQYELGGVRFGHDTPMIVTALDPGTDEWDVQDQSDANGDGIRMGRDYLRPPSWTFDLNTDGLTSADAASILADIKRAWSSSVDRTKPGAFTELAYGLAGRTRVIYGRPRRWAPVVRSVFSQGSSAVVADFKLVDSLFYDADWQTATVNLRVTSEGGWISPDVAPILTTGSGQRDGDVTVLGDVSTPMVVKIVGPIANPWVAGPGWRLDLKTSLAFDQSATIDARPFASSVLRNDGASLAGALTRSSRLSSARLNPGPSVLSFGGSDPTNTARAEFSWRPAHDSI